MSFLFSNFYLFLRYAELVSASVYLLMRFRNDIYTFYSGFLISNPTFLLVSITIFIGGTIGSFNPNFSTDFATSLCLLTNIRSDFVEMYSLRKSFICAFNLFTCLTLSSAQYPFAMYKMAMTDRNKIN